MFKLNKRGKDDLFQFMLDNYDGEINLALFKEIKGIVNKEFNASCVKHEETPEFGVDAHLSECMKPFHMMREYFNKGKLNKYGRATLEDFLMWSCDHEIDSELFEEYVSDVEEDYFYSKEKFEKAKPHSAFYYPIAVPNCGLFFMAGLHHFKIKIVDE